MNPLLFTDPAFLFLFAPVVLTGYWLVPASWRNGVLLAASLLLYAWGETRYVGVLAASIFINWAAGVAIAGSSAKLPALAAGVGANLLLLGTFKYTGFLVHNLNAIGFHSLTAPDLRLPAGLSFYTFMGISYLVDLYRRDLPQASSPGRVALYLSMFPHLIAGPIVRMTEIGGQLGDRFFDADLAAQGVRRFIIGLGKKVLIANTLATASDAIFALPAGQLPAAYAWLALACYTLQIYFDFSGYSDMAIGLAAMLGLRFPENFNYPYVSRSITEFWRRWHMTLSFWLRDYLFFPLGVRQRSTVLIVFLLCGLWHGAAWTFVAWGLWHGLLLSAERLGWERLLRRAPVVLQIVYTVAAVTLGWILFRAASLADAAAFAQALTGFGGPLPASAPIISPATYVALVAGAIAAVPWKPLADHWPVSFTRAAEAAALVLVFAAVLAAAAGNTYNPFIYFRF